MKNTDRQTGTATGRMIRLAVPGIVLAMLLATAPPREASVVPEGIAPPEFHYQIENRADPFEPFITEKATSVTNMNEIVDEEGPLTGMQLFEPGQLTLVALMQSGEGNIAMVQDFSGKGYVLTEGMLIGRRGVVSQIKTNSVVIEETARTRAGKKIVTEKVMTLKKEEGED
ncbi:pilus assembly protein PilP [Desulforhopalus vacuolatus]|uniref:pilus assembly protein PilP n=1 Tax=Desulforhopalus vacuolatus TaxID=40414 RepID=UPI001966B6F0|nr:pilus assembly protein PilP [Desulforhopalus vacuolatus]MBM9519675.1 pilus assembly protein PilP [Desulforhopalus vacuolatus]